MSLFFFFHLSLLLSSSAFNLEPSIAIIKKGIHGTYFGFSVAQHQILSGNKIQSFLLVGAPLENSNTSSEGLWKCPYTTQLEDCSPVSTKEWKIKRGDRNGQWLGGLVYSQGPGQKVIVCAHRYTKKESDHRWGNGRCFTLSQELKHLSTWDPCEGREKTRAHEEWGFCQAGTSGLLTEDDIALIGSPGPFTWRGTVFAMSIEDDFLFRDKTHYHTPVKDASSIDKYSYLGMSLAAGNFLPSSKSCGQALSYAAGAPRAGSMGKIYIFAKCEDKIMQIQRILSGDSFASSFGYTLASTDLNGDGYTELIVGAPFYGSNGAVYVYKNSGNGLGFDAHIKLESPNLQNGPRESRFGFSIANAGDLNADGKNDLIVGAPYDGLGKVFVYNGGSFPELLKYSQTLKSEDLPYPKAIRSFGYSLSGGLDMDANNHSDIVIGAFESDAAILIRSRPVIDIITWFGQKNPKVIHPNQKGCESDLLSNEVCFGIESCFLIKNFPPNIDSTHIMYSLEAEIFPGGRKLSRIRFGDQYSNASHVSEKIIAVERDSLTGCFYETAYLREGTTDIQSSVKFLLTLKLDLDEPQDSKISSLRPHNINQFPILNAEEAFKVLELSFHKSCGNDELCHSHLVAQPFISNVSKENFLEIFDEGEVILSVVVSNEGEPAFEASLTLSLDDSAFDYIGRYDTQPFNCDFFPSQTSIILCHLGNPFVSSFNDSLSPIILLFRFLPKDSIIKSEVYFNVSTNTTSEDEFRTQSLKLRIVKRAQVSIRSSVSPQSIIFGGKLMGESSMKSLSDIGSKVTHTFQILNEGPWYVSQLSVLIDFPIQLQPKNLPGVSFGKWLLYLSDAPEIVPFGAGECFISPKVINSLGLSRRHRFKRSSLFGNPIHHTYVKNNNNDDELGVALDCKSGTTLCHSFECQLHNLRANESVVIRFKSRIWNSTLVDEFEHSSVRITASATVVLPSDLEPLLENDTTTAVLIGFPLFHESRPLDGVPLWIIFVSILIGLILLTLLAMLLWKLGFFRRSRHTKKEPPEEETDLMISVKMSSSDCDS